MDPMEAQTDGSPALVCGGERAFWICLGRGLPERPGRQPPAFPGVDLWQVFVGLYTPSAEAAVYGNKAP